MYGLYWRVINLAIFSFLKKHVADFSKTDVTPYQKKKKITLQKLFC